jgi:hypothetical protein
LNSTRPGRAVAALSLSICLGLSLACTSNAANGGSGGGGGAASGGQPATGGATGNGGAGAQGSGGSIGQGGASATGGATGLAGMVGSTCTSCPYTWKNVAIGGGGFVPGIVFSPAQSGLVYARTDVGGFYRSTDGGAHWTPLTDEFSASQSNYLGGESIAPDPTDANIVYAAAGMYETAGNGVILRSTDQGTSWAVNAISAPMGGNDTGRGMGERLAVDPNNNAVLYFGSRGSGLYKSTNSGANWTKVTAFPVTGDVATTGTSYGLPVVLFDKRGGSAAGSMTIYVAAATTAAGSNLYHSTDGGTTWSEVAGGPTGLMAHHGAVGSDGTVWLAYGNNYGPYNTNSSVKLIGQVWTLSASGTWTNVTPPAANWGGMGGGISVDAQDPMHVIVSTLDWYAPDRILMTSDGGTSWSVVGQPPISGSTAGSTYDDQGAAYWYSANATLIGTNATNWVEAVALDPFDSNHAMHGSGAGIWSSSDIASATGTSGQGVTWSFTDAGLEETVPQYMMPSVSGAFLGAIGDLGGMRNTDLDSYSTTGEYTNPIQSNVTWIDFAESNPNTVVRAGNSGKVASDVAYSSDNGATWKPCAAAPAGYTTANKMRSVAVAADGSRFVVTWSSGSGFAAVATASCAGWTATTGLPSGAVVAADRVTAGTFYATSGTTLYVSTDGGMTFASANTFTGKGAPRPVFGQAGEVWVAAGTLFRFTGAGATKTQVSSITSVTGIGFGSPASGQTHPALFAIGSVGGQYGFWRSDDGAGASWTRMNDDAHQFGGLQGNYIGGDEMHFGRVFLTTGGRGYIYGDPN